MKCDCTHYDNEKTIGKECDCAGCWPRGTHGCPGCEQCDGVVTDCPGPIDPDFDGEE